MIEELTKLNNKDEETKLSNKKMKIIDDPSYLDILYYEVFLDKKKMYIIALILNVSSFYLYYISLEGCVGTQIECLKVMTIKKFFSILYTVLCCCFCLNIVMLLVYYRKVSILSIVYPFFFYLFFYFIDNGSDLAHHGKYNFFGLCLFLTLFFVVSLLIIKMIFLFLKGKRKLVYIILISIAFFFLIIIIYLFNKISCQSWNIGLNNVKLDNDRSKYPCEWVSPKKCYMNAFDGFLDFTKFKGRTCDKIGNPKDQKKKLFKFLDLKKFGTATKIGFPITTTRDFWLRTQKNIEHFSERVLTRVVDMEHIPENSLKPEVYIDFSDKNYPYGKINMNLNKNNSLVEQREKISKNTTSTFDNILFIYIDSLSRQHIKRKMKYISSFIEKYMGKTDNSNFKSYQFLKYHTFAAFTQKNVQPMFYGEKMDPTSSNGTSLIKFMKSQGYITGQSTNLCSKELFVTMNNCLNEVEFSDFDHENVAMFCDPNYYDRTNPYPVFSGPFSVIRRCLYQRDTYEYVLEYGKQFWETYAQNKKFLRLSFIDAHEGTGEVVKYLDKPLYDFLTNLLNQNMLKNTAIIFTSDHGNGMPGFYYIINSEDYMYESVIGFLAFVLYDYKDKNGINNLEKNQQTLISPYDIHDTLIDIIYNGDKTKSNLMSRNGQSLFKDINSMERSCNTYSELVDELCRCKKY